MFSARSIRAVLLPALVSVAMPLAAQAQEVQLFTWSGRVDREVRIDARARSVSNTNETSIRSRARFGVTRELPQRPGMIRVVTNMGRGTVNVLQQPTAKNGYAAVIQIVDNEGGADTYRVTAYWTASGDPRFGRGNRGMDRGNRGMDRDDRRNGKDGDDRRNGKDGDDRRNGEDRDDRRNGMDNRVGRDNAPLLQWSGEVDDVIQLVWRNGAVRVEQGSGASPRGVRSTVSGAMRNDLPGQITLNVRDGRGRVEVIQQPTAANRYTGIIRISDPQSGYGRYSFDATWR